MQALNLLLGFGLLCWTAATLYVGIQIGKRLAARAK